MSDGPEKTLKMRKSWRREVAKEAHARLEAYEAGDVSRKVFEALRQDWNAEIPSELIATRRRLAYSIPKANQR